MRIANLTETEAVQGAQRRNETKGRQRIGHLINKVRMVAAVQVMKQANSRRDREGGESDRQRHGQRQK